MLLSITLNQTLLNLDSKIPVSFSFVVNTTGYLWSDGVRADKTNSPEIYDSKRGRPWLHSGNNTKRGKFIRQ